jgi:hypothetical protein
VESLSSFDWYRYLIDAFQIERCPKLRKKNFVLVADFIMKLKIGKKVHLCEFETDSLAEGLNSLLEIEVEIPRIKHGNKQPLDILICEETLLLAMCLRNERKEWTRRIPTF